MSTEQAPVRRILRALPRPAAWLLPLLLSPAAAALAGAPAVQAWTLENGARVLFVESRSLPILDVAVDFRAGSAFDPPDRSGLAAMTQHLARFGAGGLTEEEIARRLGDVGAQLSGRIDVDRAGFVLRTLSTRPERTQALDVFARVVQSPDVPLPALERERARIGTNLREEATRPGIIASRLFFAAAYGSHPYAARPLGDADGVRALTRETVVDFRRRFYSGVSAVVSIVGDVSRAEAGEIARQVAGGLPTGSVRPPLPPVASLAAGQVRRVPHPSLQSHILIGTPAASRSDPDFFALLVGNHVLGGSGFSSRLVAEVREKRGFAYSVFSSIQPWLDRGPFQISLQTRKDQTDEALAVVRSVLFEFLSKGPTDAEMNSARRNLVSGFPLRIDTNRELLDQVSMIGFHDLPVDWLSQWPKLVERVTREDVVRAFQRLDPQRLVTVVVGAGDEAPPPPAPTPQQQQPRLR
ncbi:MAG: M16 family metallopeptidase [bacterium]|jgi:zinc protease|nr:insulinase family protein [Betaproteobacteria bacterium]